MGYKTLRPIKGQAAFEMRNIDGIWHCVCLDPSHYSLESRDVNPLVELSRQRLA